MKCVKHNNTPQCSLEIKFSNVKQNERFVHPIVLIRGNITNYDHRHGVTNLVFLNANNNSNANESTKIANDGTFRAIVQLTTGKNLLRFQYCCVADEISIEFYTRENVNYLLKPYYIICTGHDGCFQSDDNITTNSSETEACKRINVAIQLVKCLYGEMIAKHTFQRKTFEFVECQIFLSKLSIEDARKYTPLQLWEYHTKEIICSEHSDNRSYKYLGILASTQCVNGEIQGNAALGIGDVAVLGSGTLYSWPSDFNLIQKSFENETPVDGKMLMDDSNGRSTYGGCFATALGSLAHEIGHIFDLGHTVDGIMGTDIDYVNRVFVAERFPRKLPPRQISNCLSSALQRQNDTDSVTTHRLTSVKKTNSLLSNYHSRKGADLTFLTENCAILLNHHKWFNQCEQMTYEFRYAFEQYEIYSLLFIILVEIRSNIDGLCIKYYRFDELTNRQQFTIPIEYRGKKYEFVVLDQNGNIGKFAIDSS